VGLGPWYRAPFIYSTIQLNQLFSNPKMAALSQKRDLIFSSFCKLSISYCGPTRAPRPGDSYFYSVLQYSKFVLPPTSYLNPPQALSFILLFTSTNPQRSFYLIYDGQ
jgi:hypothetical protein